MVETRQFVTPYYSHLRLDNWSYIQTVQYYQNCSHQTASRQDISNVELHYCRFERSYQPGYKWFSQLVSRSRQGSDSHFQIKQGFDVKTKTLTEPYNQRTCAKPGHNGFPPYYTTKLGQFKIYYEPIEVFSGYSYSKNKTCSETSMARAVIKELYKLKINFFHCQN